MTKAESEPGETRPQLHVVTGAFGFSGKYHAERLLRAGYEVHTLIEACKAVGVGRVVHVSSFSPVVSEFPRCRNRLRPYEKP